jgi:hypothetical protein
VGGRRWEKSLQYKINIRKEEKKPTKVHHWVDLRLEMLDTIVPCLDDMGRQILYMLSTLNQEGKWLWMGAWQLGLLLLSWWRECTGPASLFLYLGLAWSG